MPKMGVNPEWCMQSMLKMSRFGNVRGSSNIHKSNTHRDLMTCLGKPSIPEPYMVQVPMVLPELGTAQVQQGYVAYPMLLPHELLAFY